MGACTHREPSSSEADPLLEFWLPAVVELFELPMPVLEPVSLDRCDSPCAVKRWCEAPAEAELMALLPSAALLSGAGAATAGVFLPMVRRDALCCFQAHMGPQQEWSARTWSSVCVGDILVKYGQNALGAPGRWTDAVHDLQRGERDLQEHIGLMPECNVLTLISRHADRLRLHTSLG